MTKSRAGGRSAWVLALVMGAMAPAAALGQGDLSAMDDTDLGVRATTRFTAQPETACPAAHEYTRRGARNTKSEAVKVVVAYCIKNGFGPDGAVRPAAKAAVAVAAATASPPIGR